MRLPLHIYTICNCCDEPTEWFVGETTSLLGAIEIAKKESEPEYIAGAFIVEDDSQYEVKELILALTKKLLHRE